MIKNVTPIFLDGPAQAISSGTTTVTWDGLSSFVSISNNGARTFTLPNNIGGKKIQFGTVVVVIKADSNSNALTINPTSDHSSAVQAVTLAAQNQCAMFIWKGPRGTNTIGEWALLSLGIGGAGSAFTGGSVSGATTFDLTVSVTGLATLSGGVDISKTIKYDATPLIVALGTNQADAKVLTTEESESNCLVVSSSANNQGIVLPNMTSGTGYHVFNSNGTNNLKVYVATGASLNSVTDSVVTIAPGTSRFFLSTGSGSYVGG